MILCDPLGGRLLLGFENSAVFVQMVGLMLARVSLAQSFEVGIVRAVPIPNLATSVREQLHEYVRRIHYIRRDIDAANGTSHAFLAPTIVVSAGTTLVERAAAWDIRERTSDATVAAIQAKIDDLAFRLYGVDAGDRSGLTSTLVTEATGDAGAETDDEEENVATGDAPTLTADFLAYALGCGFGRWDIRYATGERPAPELPDPFAPLPVCPPGMLQGRDGLPLSPEAGRRLWAEGRYPVDVAWDGVLVDDPEHPLDLQRSVHACLSVLWGDRADTLEHEACGLLGVPNLREWFRRPAGFFADHLKRYSKSRRKAPIYWPLSTASGSYMVWIYYHRVTADTLFQVAVEYLDPKIRKVQKERFQLDGRLGRAEGREAARLAKQTGELAELEQELEEMKAELLRVAELPYKPDLNDGVQIAAAPLWKLFRLPAWRKVLEATWKKLEKGEYDWSSLAYTIWPERVREGCRTDRSLAIAHGLEDLCEAEVAPKKRRRKKGNA